MDSKDKGVEEFLENEYTVKRRLEDFRKNLE